MIRRAGNVLGALERALTVIATIALFAIMALVVADVFMRYVLNSPFSFTYDLIGLYLLAAVFFLTSLGLTYFSAPARSGGVVEQLEIPAVPQGTPAHKPAAPAPSAPAPAASKPSNSLSVAEACLPRLSRPFAHSCATPLSLSFISVRVASESAVKLMPSSFIFCRVTSCSLSTSAQAFGVIDSDASFIAFFTSSGNLSQTD